MPAQQDPDQKSNGNKRSRRDILRRGSLLAGSAIAGAAFAYILNLNGRVADNAALDAKSLAAIKMPNRDGFVLDPRPDVKNEACTSNCKN